MAIDSKKKRSSCIGISYVSGVSPTPDVAKDKVWRQAAGYCYAGFEILGGVDSWRRRRKFVSTIRRRRVI